jgi:multicomponent K+:H+ antiporter subunit E
MSRIFPYPLLIISLVIMWLLLTSFSLGQLLLGTVVAFIAVQGVAALHPATPRIRRRSSSKEANGSGNPAS